MTDKELEKIYNEAYRAVYWTAFSLLKNEDDAQDVVQDTFIALFNSYDSIKDKSKIVAWLKKVAANRSLDRLRRTKTDAVEDEFFDDIETVPEDFLPDSLVESAEMRKIIMDIINNSLSEDVRRTLILFYFDEMSTKEIAEALGIPEGTVSRRIHSAKKKIKKEVEKYEEDNDTKLFMVVPFLTSLFTKEAEQVPFRPMPASLLNLSASTGAAEAAGSKIAAEAIKKGTEIAMKKIIIAAISVALAGAATTGIIYYVTHKDDNTGTKEKNKKKAENEIAEIEQDDESNGASKDGTGSGAAGSGSNVVWADSAHFYVNGKEIVLDQSSVQDLYDSGCYCIFFDSTRDYKQTYFYELDDEVEFTSAYIYPDEESALAGQSGSKDPTGAIFIGISHPKDQPDDSETYTVRDGIVRRISGTPENIALWGDYLKLDFPLTMTSEQLLANSGNADEVFDNTYHYDHSEEYEYAEFKFDENDQLTEFTLNGGGNDIKTETATDSGSEGGSDDDFATADRHYVNYVDLKVSVKGTVITMGKSTIQDVLDAGTYVNPHLLNRTAAYGLKLDDPLEAGDLVYMTVFDLEDGEDWPSGQNANYPMVFLAKAEKAGPVSEAVICGVHYQTNMSEAWENEVIFEFPFTLTPEALVADSGEATSVETGTDESYYRYENGDCSMVFIFYKGELKSIYGEYDAGSRIDLTYGLVGVEE
ncbi:MAG: sigma-70 family RNA polymerase sigma factor [Clostridiales bacterium]|nr:sigma-70 family RNA polymerase sigma factor [Clostridiales bacterium]